MGAWLWRIIRDLAFSLESVRDFVTEKATDLRAAFDQEAAKA
jgi:hypothetical protein